MASMDVTPQSRLSPHCPELAGPLAELADGTWAPAAPGPAPHIEPLLSPREREAASSPAAIEAGARDLEARMDAAAQRERARVW
jgi:hypothetical protein